MKVSIRRHGIIIKTLEVKGDRAEIGSGAECAIHIEDPYLAAHVADLVNAGGTWKLVDTGLALDGVSLEGRRVEDEPLMPGATYTVGGFELVAEGFAAPAGATPTGAAPTGRPEHAPTLVEGSALPPESSVPKTMYAPAPQGVGTTPKTEFATPTPNVPKTEFAAPVPPRASEPKLKPSPAAGLAFKPVTSGGTTPSPAAPVAGAAASGGKSSKKLLLIVAVAGLLVVLVAIIVLGTGGGEKKTEPQVATTTATETTATQASKPAKAELTAADYTKQGDEHAQKLEIEQAIVSWEAAIDHGAGPEIKQRIVRTALEVGLVYHAAHDNATAKKYFEAVIRWGAPGSPEVKLAQSRL